MTNKATKMAKASDFSESGSGISATLGADDFSTIAIDQAKNKIESHVAALKNGSVQFYLNGHLKPLCGRVANEVMQRAQTGKRPSSEDRELAGFIDFLRHQIDMLEKRLQPLPVAAARPRNPVAADLPRLTHEYHAGRPAIEGQNGEVLPHFDADPQTTLTAGFDSSVSAIARRGYRLDEVVTVAAAGDTPSFTQSESGPLAGLTTEEIGWQTPTLSFPMGELEQPHPDFVPTAQSTQPGTLDSEPEMADGAACDVLPSIEDLEAQREVLRSLLKRRLQDALNGGLTQDAYKEQNKSDIETLNALGKTIREQRKQREKEATLTAQKKPSDSPSPAPVAAPQAAFDSLPTAAPTPSPAPAAAPAPSSAAANPNAAQPSSWMGTLHNIARVILRRQSMPPDAETSFLDSHLGLSPKIKFHEDENSPPPAPKSLWKRAIDRVQNTWSALSRPTRIGICATAATGITMGLTGIFMVASINSTTPDIQPQTALKQATVATAAASVPTNGTTLQSATAPTATDTRNTDATALAAVNQVQPDTTTVSIPNARLPRPAPPVVTGKTVTKRTFAAASVPTPNDADVTVRHGDSTFKIGKATFDKICTDHPGISICQPQPQPQAQAPS